MEKRRRGLRLFLISSVSCKNNLGFIFTRPKGKHKVSILQKINFGKIDAESEVRQLANYFVDTGVINQLANGEKRFVMGRKGSGKTALFVYCDAEKLGNTVIKLDFNDYAWDLHKQIRKEGMLPESAYTASWKFTFLVAVCKDWASSKNAPLQKQASEFLENIYGKDDIGKLEALIDKVKRIRKLKLPEINGVGGLGEIEFDEKEAGPVLATTVIAWSEKLLAFVRDNYPAHPFTIMVDRLDDGWDATPESKCLIAGVLKAARDLNQALYQGKGASPLIICLRSDIFDEIQFNDKNKVSAETHFLDWSEKELVDVINMRIDSSIGRVSGRAWDKVFSPTPMRQQAAIDSYILKRTMWRPRDIIAFCTFCLEKAKQEKHDLIETADVYEAEVKYSRHIYNELDDEMHKQAPQAKSLLKAVREVGMTRFDYASWLAASSAIIGRELSEVEAKENLKLLFDFSVVGVPKVGGKGGGSSFQFVYHDRHIEPNFDGDMVVHPALYKDLGLKEPRTKAAGA